MHKTIPVTKEIIAEATTGNSSHCMIAEAVKAAGFKRVSVDIQTVRFTDDTGDRYIYLTPPAAQVAILQFDEGRKPAPFKLHLRNGQVIPRNVAKQEHDREHKRKVREDAKKRGGKKSLLGLEKITPQIEITEPGEHNTVRITGGRPVRLSHVGQRRVFGLRQIVGRAAKRK